MELQEYLQLRYKPRQRRASHPDVFECCAAPRGPRQSKECSPILNKIAVPKAEKSFMKQVFDIIDEKGLNDVETYKKANIDRRLFSKMKSDMDNYRPSRDTAFKFCFALELDLAKAKKLLSSAGFAISRSSVRDLIFEYCLVEKIYDLMKVNDKLYEMNVEPELE